jgi:hypothetical protein
MITHKVSEKIYGIKSEQVREWFIELDQDKYQSWHPDHTSYQIKNQTEGYLGSEIKYLQSVDGVNFWWKVVGVSPDQIKYKAKFIYPIYLIVSFQDYPDFALVTQEIQIGLESKITSWFLDWFVRKFIFSDEVSAKFTTHTQQELKNLQTLLQS